MLDRKVARRYAENPRRNIRMKSGDYIWQAGDWPDWRYDLAALTEDVLRTSEIDGERLDAASACCASRPPGAQYEL